MRAAPKDFDQFNRDTLTTLAWRLLPWYAAIPQIARIWWAYFRRP